MTIGSGWDGVARSRTRRRAWSVLSDDMRYGLKKDADEKFGRLTCGDTGLDLHSDYRDQLTLIRYTLPSWASF